MIHFLLIIVMISILLLLIATIYSIPRIDFIYTWVDVPGKEASLKSNDEILFSLRSICRFANWFHRVYLVISDAQKPPDWLDPRQLIIVRHSEIIPLENLPTFNSLVIESFLHRIQDLSEYYIYFNDDMILLNKVSKNDFFSWGKPFESSCHPIQKITDAIDDSYQFSRLMKYNNELLDRYFGPNQRSQSQHIPSSNRKSFQSGLDRFLDHYKLEKHTKTRDNKNIARYSLFKKYWNIYRYHCREKIYDLEYIEINHLRSKSLEIKKLIHSKKKFLCIQNSISYGDKNEMIGKMDYIELKKILIRLFPEKCIFEK